MNNINWQIISTFDIERINFEKLQFQMSNIYGSIFTESNRSNYMKFVNILQMIIIYNEYCNLQLNDTNQQIDKDIENIDELIMKQEAKLLKSKKHYYKCKQFKNELRKMKAKPNIVYGCIHCEHEFKDTIMLDRHMEVHKDPPNAVPQLLIMQKELQAQLALLYETKQQRRQLQLMKEDLNCGMIAAAERNYELQSDEKFQDLRLMYEEKVQKLEKLLQMLQEKQSKPQLTFNNEWLDDIQNEINLELQNKREEEQLLQRQMVETQKSQVLLRQSSIKIKTNGPSSKSQIKSSFSQLPAPGSQIFIQSQSGGNHRFLRNKQGNIYADDSDNTPTHEIIIEEEEQNKQFTPKHHKQGSSSILKKQKPKHSKNPSGVSFNPSEGSLQGLTTFEKFELKQKEFNKLVCDILQNRFFFRRTQFEQEEIQREKEKLEKQLESMNIMDLEGTLKQLKSQTTQFANRRRFEIKKKKIIKSKQEGQQERENTITTLESSSDQELSEKKSDGDKKEGPETLTELGKFPFQIKGEKQIMQKDQPQEGQEQHQGYGVNEFSLNY